MNYATLTEFKRYANMTETSDDALLTDFLDWSSRFIEQWKGRRFDVRLETRLYDRPMRKRGTFGIFDSSFLVGGGWLPLRVRDDLLAVIELLNGDGSEMTDFVLEPGNVYPKNRIRLQSGTEFWSADADGNDEQCISVTGWWGYHDRYPESFVDSLDNVQNNPLSAVDTSLSVLDADSVAADLRGPRFQAGQMIKVEDELMLITAVDATLNSLTVVRGYNGTTAVEHLQDDRISIFRVMSTIVTACVRLVKWRYSQKDSDVFDKTYIVGQGTTIPTAIPYDVIAVLGARKVTL